MTRKFISTLVLLFAVIGAYATAKNTALDLVYIQISSSECRLVEGVSCANLGGICIREVFTVGTSTSLGYHQIYQDPPISNNSCRNPFDDEH